MEEKISEDLKDDASRVGASSEAAGAVPPMRDRLSENEDAQARFMLMFDNQIYDADAAKWWADLAGMDRPTFEKQAADLVKPHGVLAMLRAVAAASTEISSGRDR
jgi:hypothetical protein